MTDSVARAADRNLRRVVYTSHSRLSDAQAEAGFHAIADRAHIANRDRGITAVLIYDGGRFFQVIEGDGGSVERLLDRLRVDRRHDGMRIIEDGPISGRQFGPSPLYAYFLADRAFDADPDLMRARQEHRTLFSQAMHGGRSMVEATRSMMAAFDHLAV